VAEAKPSEFFIGVVELFGVLAPGSILLATGLWAFEDRFQKPWEILGPEAQWAVFLVAAYTVGTFLFLLSAIIDELIYDPWREARWPKESDLAFKQAEAIRDGALQVRSPPKPRKLHWAKTDPPTKLPGLKTRLATFRKEFAKVWGERVLLKPAEAPVQAMNTLSWAKSVLMLRAPAAYADVLRYEAESKFFRSMILVAPAAGMLVALKVPGLKGIALALAIAAPVTILSFLRYAERRYKGSEWAYRYLIAREFGPQGPEPGPRGGSD
jgi:hypothetical protein